MAKLVRQCAHGFICAQILCIIAHAQRKYVVMCPYFLGPSSCSTREAMLELSSHDVRPCAIIVRLLKASDGPNSPTKTAHAISHFIVSLYRPRLVLEPSPRGVFDVLIKTKQQWHRQGRRKIGPSCPDWYQMHLVFC